MPTYWHYRYLVNADLSVYWQIRHIGIAVIFVNAVILEKNDRSTVWIQNSGDFGVGTGGYSLRNCKINGLFTELLLAKMASKHYLLLIFVYFRSGSDAILNFPACRM